MMNILQSLKDACRWVCFETNIEGWEVATHGGTLFIVTYEGVPYGLTARHNLHSFEWGNLIVTKTRLGDRIAGLREVSYAKSILSDTDGSDLFDVAIVKFSADIDPEYFEGSIYDLDMMPVCESRVDDDLIIYGALTTPSFIGNSEIVATFAELGFVDVGPNSHDQVLREANGQWLNSKVNDLNGLSGCPVFNTTQGGLCGMMVRGGVAEDTGIATSHFVDILYIAHVLHSAHES